MSPARRSRRHSRASAPEGRLGPSVARWPRTRAAIPGGRLPGARSRAAQAAWRALATLDVPEQVGIKRHGGPAVLRVVAARGFRLARTCGAPILAADELVV